MSENETKGEKRDGSTDRKYVATPGLTIQVTPEAQAEVELLVEGDLGEDSDMVRLSVRSEAVNAGFYLRAAEARDLGEDLIQASGSR